MKLLRLLILIFCTIFLSSLVFSVTYSPSKNVFNGKIIDIYDTGDYNYILDLELNNLIDGEFKYDVEIIYSKENLVVGKEAFTCPKTCSKSVNIEKTFFGDYEIHIRAKSNKNYYEKNLEFSLKQEEKNKYQINLNPIYYIEDLSLNIHGEINQINEEESTYIFEIFPMTSPEIKSEFKIQCEDDLCPFQFKISETILIDTYIVNIYSPLGDSQKTFKVEFAKDKIKIENESKDNIKNSWKKFDKFTSMQKELPKNMHNHLIYKEKGSQIKTKVNFKKNNLSVLPSFLSFEEKVDLEFNFENSTLKNLKIKNVDPSEVILGLEKIANDKITQFKDVKNAFAINPIFPNYISDYSLTFTANGDSLYKCTQYNFSTQTCFGNFTKILNTTPGETYTINLTVIDPIFVEIIADTNNDARARDGVLQLDNNPIRLGNNNGRIFDVYFRFPSVSVPIGATITNAYINLTSTANRNGNNVLTNIYAFKEADCLNFNTGAGGDDPTDNLKTTNFTSWDNIPAWSNLEQGPNTQTPNLSSIIQEVINLPAWQKDNALCFAIEDDGSSNNAFRDIATTDETAAELFIDYIDPPSSVVWNATTLSIDTKRNTNTSINALITSVLANNNVTITNLGGNASSFISINVSNLGNMLDDEKSSIAFTCSPNSSQSTGTFSSIYKVNSTQNPAGSNLTILCTVIIDPYIEIIEPLSISPKNVTDNQEITVKFRVYNSLGTQVTTNIDLIEAKVGNLMANITKLTPLSFHSNFSVSAEMTTPFGIAVYGNSLWVTSNDLDSVVKYSTAGTYLQTYSISSQTTAPRGITTIDGSEFWVSDNAGPNPDDTIIHYDSNFNYLDDFAVSGETGNPYGVTFNGTDFYVSDDTNADSILHYDVSGTYIDSIPVDAYTTSSRGITMWGDNLWFVDAGGVAPNNEILHFKVDGTLVDNFSIDSETTTPVGIATLNSNQFYIVDNLNQRILFYSSNNTKYVTDHFEANITLPADLGGLQNLSLTIMFYPDKEYILNDIEINALSFPEKIPPATITNLQNISSADNWIYWNWTNPLDSDYSHAYISLNGIWIANVSNIFNYYNATGLNPNSYYNISIMTVDVNGNINTTAINSTGKTKAAPFVNDITPINESQYLQYSQINISANVTDLSGISSVQAFIIWDLGSEYVTLLDLDGNDIYEGIFNTTSNFGTYNLTIIAINTLGYTNDTQKITFDIITDTPFLDTYISSSNPNNRYDTNSRIRTDSLGDIRRALIRFDLSHIPLGVRIDNATMQLYLEVEGGGDLNHAVYAINETWNETVTWNTQPNYINTIWASTLIQTPSWYYWNITDLTKNWYNNSLENFGIMLFEPGETTNGRKQYWSADSGSLVPELRINYTDITPPLVTDLTPINGSHEQMNSSIEISAKVTDNVAVDRVFANITWNGNSQLIELFLKENFIYSANFTNNNYLGRYNVTIIANDTTNLINNSQTTFFYTNYLHLKIIKQIERNDDDNFLVDLKLTNEEIIETPKGKSLFVYMFIPNLFNITTPFFITTSSRYTSLGDIETLNDSKYNGSIYSWKITPTSSNIGSLDKVNSSDSMWGLYFNVSAYDKYFLDDIIIAIDPD
ncbi:MAG: DNRLRE domain-containing protein [Nanoarchaeota archaeon]|nr:DNRLRE domain-containing protein [Nanoarchaeota archaeon]